MIYGLIVFGMMWFVIVPLVDPVMLKLNGLIFPIAHLMWGASLSLLLGWQREYLVAPQHAHGAAH